MTTHTPTPWYTDESDQHDIRRYIMAENETFICRFEGEELKNERANAAFIVHACNAHDELVDVVEQFVNGAFTNAITSDHEETFERLLARAHHVLTRAKGGVV